MYFSGVEDLKRQWPYGKDLLKKRIWKERIFLRNKIFATISLYFCLLFAHEKSENFAKKNLKIARKLMQTFREKMQKFHEKNGNCAKKNENFAKNAEFLKQTQNSNIYWSKGREFIYMT